VFANAARKKYFCHTRQFFSNKTFFESANCQINVTFVKNGPLPFPKTKSRRNRTVNNKTRRIEQKSNMADFEQRWRRFPSRDFARLFRFVFSTFQTISTQKFSFIFLIFLLAPFCAQIACTNGVEESPAAEPCGACRGAEIHIAARGQ
jgi:hypothetical protein